MKVFLVLAKRLLFPKAGWLTVFVWALALCWLSVCVSCGPKRQEQIDTFLEQGRQHYADGRYAQALELWERVLQLDPENAAVEYNMASAYHRLGDFDRSTEKLKQTIERGLRIADAYLLIAQNEIMSGSLDGAKEARNKLAEIAPSNYRLKVLSGHIESLLERYAAGEVFYREAIAINPKCSDAYFYLAANLIAQKKPSEAEDQYDLALSLKEAPTATLLLNKAQYKTLRGDIPEARKAFDQALKIDPANVYIQLKIAHLFLSAGQYRELCGFFSGDQGVAQRHETIQKLVADSYMNLGQLDDAQKILEPYFQSQAYDWLLLKGKYHLLIGNNTLAVGYLESALEQRINDPKCYNLLAIAYLADNKINLAHKTWIKLLAMAPETSDVELGIASLYYKKKHYDLSMNYLHRVIRNMPGRYRAYLIMGHCLAATGKFSAAENNYRKALALNPDSLQPLYYLAVAKENQAKTNAAIRLFLDVIEKKPDLADAGLRLARLYAKEGRIDEACNYFSVLADKQPEDGHLNFILGELHQARGDFELAGGEYRRALKKNPSLVGAYLKLIELEPDPQKQIILAMNANEKASGHDGLEMVLAGLYYSVDNLPAAISIMEKLYAKNKGSHKVANNLAWLYLENNLETMQAYELARSAYKAQPTNPNYAHTLGWASYRKGLFSQAEWHLRESLELLANADHVSGSHPERKSVFRYHLASLLCKTGKANEARELLLSATASDLPHKYQRNAKDLLEELNCGGEG